MERWAPNALSALASREGWPRIFTEKVLYTAQILTEKGLPPVLTLRHIAELTDTPYLLLRNTVAREIDPYRVFKISKKSGGFRVIAMPDEWLNTLQAWINQEILQKVPVNDISTAFSHGQSPLQNAQRHIGARWLVKMDIKNFFESISERQVFHVFKTLGYPALIAFEMARLCTRLQENAAKYSRIKWRGSRKDYVIRSYRQLRIGHLPQGAPTSPQLANMACEQLDDLLTQIAQTHGGIITRYADDVTFSAQDMNRGQARRIIADLREAMHQQGFLPNEKKTVIVPPGARKIVTGLVVSGEGVHIPRNYLNQIRMHLYYAGKYGVLEHCKRRKFKSLVGFRDRLLGQIGFVQSISVRQGTKFLEKFNSLRWPAWF